MKQFILFFALMLGMAAPGSAQTYLEHLKQKTQGLGTVTVTQSKAIDELVNGKAVPQDNKEKSAPQDKKEKTTLQEHKEKTAQQEHIAKTLTSTTANKNNKTSEPQKKLVPDSVKKAEEEKDENETPAVDMSKKVMRGSYKVTGYRVQAFAGGNSRADRLKAEQTGNAIKLKFPDQPVYVHFYSPRWICRVGNFRSQAEAQKMLAKVRAMGYKQACLVKGKITVQN